MIKRYEMLKDSESDESVLAGTIVYSCILPNYGCVQDDNRMTGVEHIAANRDPAGGYPFFTVPLEDLRLLDPAP